MQFPQVSETVRYTLLIKRLVEIVENELRIKFDSSDFSYYRLITHLRFTIERIKKGKLIENPLLEAIKKDYQETFKIAKILGNEIKNSIGKDVCEGELGYIALHLQRLVFLILLTNTISVLLSLFRHELINIRETCIIYKLMPFLIIKGTVNLK